MVRVNTNAKSVQAKFNSFKNLFSFLFLFFLLTISTAGWSQTFSWAGYADTGSPRWRGRTFSKDGYTYTNIQSGVTMSARVSRVGAEGCSETLDGFGAVTLSDECFSSNDPAFSFNCAPDGLTINGTAGLWLANNWDNKTTSDLVAITFSAPITSVNFKINDINNDANWSDQVVISAVNCTGTTVYPTSVTGLTGNFTYNAGTGTIYNTNPAGAFPDGNTGTDVTVSFGANVISSLNLSYQSNSTLPIGGSNPSYQYIVFGAINFSTYAASSLSASAVPATLCSGGSTTITATAGFSGYSWSPGGETTQAITVSPGSTTTYTVTTTDAGGCTNSTSVTVTVGSPTADAGTSPGTITCTTPTLNLSGSGGGSYSWSASGGGNITSGAATATPTINAGGTYTLTVDVGGCTATDDVIVAQDITPPSPDAGSSPGTITCTTTSLGLTATGGGTYSWSASGGGNITAGAATATPTINSGGTYTVTVTAANGCTASDNVVVPSDITPPAADAGTAGQITCSTTSLGLSGTGGGTYSWSASGGGNITAGAATATPTVNAAGTYTVTVTAANGCTASDNVVVTADITPPAADAGTAGQITCSTTSLGLSGSGGGTYSWSASGGGNITAGAATATPTVDAAGTYTVTVTAANGCTASDNVVVTSDITPPAADAGSSPGTITCSTTSLQLSGSGGGTYSWATATGNIVSGANTATPTIDAGGAYGVTVTAANGCTASDFVVVSENITAPDVNATGASLTCTITSTSISSAGGGTYSWSTSDGNIVSGANTATPVVDAAGTYTVTVTSAVNGCTASADAIVTSDQTPPSANASADQSICSGQSASLTASGGDTYAWNTGAGTASTSVSPGVTTNYTVTVTTTSNGCTASDQLTITVASTATANAGSDAVLDCSNPSLQLSASGGGTYTWAASAGGNIVSGANTATPTIDAAGTYTVTVDAGGGCTDSDDLVVTLDITPPTASAGSSPGTITCSTASLQLSASGGGTYNWSTLTGNIVSGANTATPTIDAGGSYTVTVTGTNGCTASDIVVVTENTTPPDVNATGATLTCSLTSASLIGAGGGTYSWSTLDGNIVSGGNTATPTVDAAGTYTVTVTSAINGCTASENAVVDLDQTPPAASAGTDQNICPGGSAMLTANGGGTYAWSTGDNTASSAVSPGSTTTYTVTVTSATTGCTASDEVIVVVSSSIIADAGPDTSVCSGNTVILIASGGSDYSWNTGDTTASASVNPSSATTYSVTVTSGGCSATDEVTVSVNTTPVANAGTDQSICLGDTALILASGGGTYLWDDNSTNDSLSVSPSSTTTYSLTVTGSGCTASDAITITVNTAPLADAGTDTSICSSQSVILTASGGGNYNWSSGDNTASASVSPLSTTTYFVTVTSGNCSAMDSVTVNVVNSPVADAGTGTSLCNGDSVLLTATGGSIFLWSNGNTADSIWVAPAVTTTFTVTVTENGCSDSDNVTVTVNSIPNADAGNDQAICSGQSALITASGGGTYLWSNGGSTSVISVSPGMATSFTVTVSNNGCTDVDSVLVTVNPNPVADAGADQTICPGESAAVVASGGGNYLWSNADTTMTIVVSPSNTTTYTVTVNLSGCTDTDEVTINLNPAAIADAGSDQGICEGQTVILTATGGGSYLWSTGDTTAMISDTPLTTSSYIVTVTNTFGCSATDDISVTLFATPTVTLTSDPDGIVYTGQIVTFTASPDGYYEYNFYVDSTLVQSSSSNVFLSNSLTDGQTVSVIVGENGCTSDTDSTDVNVRPIPNAFTPDGNGKNDIFAKGLDLLILNRWDQILYEGTDGWDGKYNNSYASPGTYYYIIKMVDLNNNENIIKGSVTLIANNN